MIEQMSHKSVRTAIVIAVLLGSVHGLSQTATGATFRIFEDEFIKQNSALPIATPQDLLSDDLFDQFLVAQEPNPELSEDDIKNRSTTQTLSPQSSLSFESIISSLRQINLNATKGNQPAPEVPVLPQVDAPDIYKEIYDFGKTSAEELSNPVSSGISPPPPDTSPANETVGTANSSSPGGGGPAVNNSSLPQFEGPLQRIGKPLQSFAGPLRQAGVPSATRIQAGNWGDREVDVFFASLPKAQVADVDTFMRTVYRTNLSDMVEKIDKSLDLTIDTQFNSMPADVFPRTPLPSGYGRGNL